MSNYKLTPMLFNLTELPSGFYGQVMLSNGFCGDSEEVAQVLSSNLTPDQKVGKLTEITLTVQDLECSCCYNVRGVLLDSKSPLAKPLAKRLAKYKLEVVLV